MNNSTNEGIRFLALERLPKRRNYSHRIGGMLRISLVWGAILLGCVAILLALADIGFTLSWPAWARTLTLTAGVTTAIVAWVSARTAPQFRVVALVVFGIAAVGWCAHRTYSDPEWLRAVQFWRAPSQVPATVSSLGFSQRNVAEMRQH